MKNKGITLITLIITVVLLIILAVITIGITRTESIINKTSTAADTWKSGAQKEKQILKSYEKFINEKTNNVIAYNEFEDAFYTLEDAVNQTQENYGGGKILLVNDYTLKEELLIPETITVYSMQYTLEVQSKLTIAGIIYLDSTIVSSDDVAHSVEDVRRGKVIVENQENLIMQGDGCIFDKTLICNNELQMGDTIDYPLVYNNVETRDPNAEEGDTKTYVAKETGWQVATVDEEAGEKKIKIITKGTPATFSLTESDTAESNLEGPFTVHYNDNDITCFSLKNIKEEGATYFLEKYAREYAVFGVEEVIALLSASNSDDDGCEKLLVKNGTFYWVNMLIPDHGMLYVSPDKENNTIAKPATMGIRPIIILKNDIHVYKLHNDANNSDYWKIVD